MRATHNSQNNLQEQRWRTHTSWFQNLLGSHSDKNSVALARWLSWSDNATGFPHLSCFRARDVCVWLLKLQINERSQLLNWNSREALLVTAKTKNNSSFPQMGNKRLWCNQTTGSSPALRSNKLLLRMATWISLTCTTLHDQIQRLPLYYYTYRTSWKMSRDRKLITGFYKGWSWQEGRTLYKSSLWFSVLGWWKYSISWLWW